ncbi:hypothetical protein [Vampirovibrio chlorellavorus]|uniref:hypothetical protein n=1 Tax=Vampirovibrio chlorellavorus TaxID=758823 RepID=UPI0026F0BAFE|nr:hypothetical protein [Vampirovibrio chlorellavorus]
MLSGVQAPINAAGNIRNVKSATGSPTPYPAAGRPKKSQRAGSPLSSKSGLSQLSPGSNKNLFQRIFNTPWIKRPGASPGSKRNQIVAGAQHDRKEPRNPISFEALDSMLKELDNDVDPRIGSILKNGYASGLRHLLKVGNQIISEMNQVTAPGQPKPELVIYYDHPAQGHLKDPFSARRFAYEMAPETEILCEVLTPRRLPAKFSAMNHWSNIARGKQGLSELEYLEFSEGDLKRMKDTVRQHHAVPPSERFNLNNKEELADYAFQLFNMLYNLHLAREEMALQFQRNPAHYKVGIATRHSGGDTKIHDLSHLFPGCHLKAASHHPQPGNAETPLPLEAQRALLERLFRGDTQP